ncbi:hypothetical protein ACFY4C_32305 [Actinomadura viridis]|uniref:hypothetical protein n=1 Tax=Actinomadura viridis TaxID=58110 RepID=UPI0036BDE930
MLRVGAFHVAEGMVTFAESRATPGPERLLGAFRPGGSVSGRDGADALSAAQRELLSLLVTFDAAYFLLASAAAPEFTEGVPDRLGPACRITPATLVHECERRSAELDAQWPSADLDDAPVVPVRRVRRQRVILTGLQAEVLLNADGRRTPADLAHELGHTMFGCLLAVRALAAAALVTPPRGETRALPSRRRRAKTGTTGTTGTPAPAVRPSTSSDQWEPVDHDVLVRLHAALRDLP